VSVYEIECATTAYFHSKIYETLLERLKTNWAHVLYLQREAEEANKLPPSTAPCSPAPRKRLLIIRDENHPPPGGLFVSFEHMVPNSSSTQPTAYKRDSLLQSLSEADLPSQNGQKNKRWSIFKNIFPASSNSNGRPGEVTPPQSSSGSDSVSTLDSSNRNGLSGLHVSESNPGSGDVDPNISLYQPYSFRFSMELVNRPVFPSKNMRLATPRLPAAANNFLRLRDPNPPEVTAIEPKSIDESGLKYAGRALAEWSGIIDDCDNFFERRKSEGVPANKLVETPLLLADSALGGSR
jgi:hypothetical protein